MAILSQRFWKAKSAVRLRGEIVNADHRCGVQRAVDVREKQGATFPILINNLRLNKIRVNAEQHKALLSAE